MSKVILSGYYGFDNFGDEAILQVLIENLKALDCDITVLSHNPDKTAQIHNVETIFTFNLFKIVKKMSKSDVLISGGGSLLQDVTSIRSLIYYLLIIFLGNLFCKRVIIFAQGIGPIKNKITQYITKNLLKKVNLITVRDKRSLDLVTSWGLKAELVNDPVWGINLKPTIPRNKIGIQLRDWKYMSDEFFINLVRKVANEFADKEICIYSLQDRQDKEICMRFENYLHLENPKVKTKLYYGLNINEIIKNMSNLEYFIAMRYHSIMIAAKYGIKTLAINYDPKVESLAKFLKIPYINFENYSDFDEYFNKMRSLSRRSMLLKTHQKNFSFDIFKKEINPDL